MVRTTDAGTGGRRAGAALACALAMALGVAAARAESRDAKPSAPRGTAADPGMTVSAMEDAMKQPPIAVTAGQIAQRPDAYAGKNVTVRAHVAEVIGPRIFSLDEDPSFAGPDLLVLAPAGSSASEREEVTVTGVVRPFVHAELQRDYAWFHLAPEQELLFKWRPVLVASSLTERGDSGEQRPGR